MDKSHNRQKEIVVLGGGYAGILAALRLAKRALSSKITLVDANDGLVERIRLHQVAVGQKSARLPYKELFQGMQVNFIKARVIAINAAERTIELKQDERLFQL